MILTLICFFYKMTDNHIPESEINWLYGINKEYKITVGKDYNSIYPVALLPPTLRKFVKLQNPNTEYINMGPCVESIDGMLWSVWGWTSLPTSSEMYETNWKTTFLSKKDSPSMKDLHKKIKCIQTELEELRLLFKLYETKN